MRKIVKTFKFIYDFTKYGYHYGIQGQSEMLGKGLTPLFNVCFMLNFENILVITLLYFTKSLREHFPPLILVLSCVKSIDRDNFL